jgi:hypothetical protein
MGSRAEAVAGFICDSVPDNELESLDDLATDPLLLTSMTKSEPKLARYQGWLVSLLRDLQERVQARYSDMAEGEEETPEVASPSGNGNTPEGAEVPKP